MNVIADLCVVPLGVGVSVSKYVAACEKVLNEAGLNINLHSYGTNNLKPEFPIEGYRTLKVRNTYTDMIDSCNLLHHIPPLLQHLVIIILRLIQSYTARLCILSGNHLAVGTTADLDHVPQV